jgi:predicted SnoaL-like aldol condensation-catalyzing enzyme
MVLAIAGGGDNLKRMLLGALLLGSSSISGAQAPSGERCAGTVQDNRRVVLAFYNEGLIGLKPRQAFERYMSADFIEHKPEVPGGTRDATAAFLEQLIADVPKARWTVERTIAEGDFVFLHARFSPAPGAPEYALADIFRLKHCKIVEHWDVVAAPPKEQRNPNSRF